MNKIYQLAVPKGRRICCEVCEAPAERVCPACTVTYYCDVVHQKTDWNSIHEKICQLLIPLRTTMPFYNSEEERQHGLQQLQKRQTRSSRLRNIYPKPSGQSSNQLIVLMPPILYCIGTWDFSL
uniref:Zinc finger MYND-type containing 12 n=1 Tax=Pipistrellus kuhlii TaxID=59472 RepID=A0A7J8ACL7_PIPKU|nr:zinc finger MYND-type containing 12 [Pipistrellus kuhlii]